MDKNVIVVDCNWFTHGSEKLVKQVAFCDTKSGLSHLYKLSIPLCLLSKGLQFSKQARHSHGLEWSEKGEYSCDRMSHVMNDIVQRLDSSADDVIFWAKGREKSKLLSTYGFDVSDLDEIQCPKYRQLTNRKLGGLSKAETFANWMLEHFYI